MLAWLSGWPALVQNLLSSLAGFALSTPDLTDLRPVQTLWQITLGASAGVAVLLVLAAVGLEMVPGAAGIAPSFSVRALALRLFGAVLLATQSLHLARWLLTANNVLVRLCMPHGGLASVLRAPAPSGGLLVALLTVIPYVGLLLVLAVIYAIRLAELLVLVAFGPVAAVFLIHPVTGRFTALWAAELVAVTFLPSAQAVLLALFQVVVLVLPAREGVVPSLATSLALLVLTLRLPGWLGRFVHSVGNATIAGWLARAGIRRFP
jgi:hypothetical protein